MLNLYGLIVGVGIAIAMTVAERVSAKSGSAFGGRLPLWEAFWYMAVPGLVGARLYHVIHEWEYYQANLDQVLAVWNGGMGIWGGILGALAGLLMFSFLRARREDTRMVEEFFILADIFGLAAPLSQSIGRWGNWFNQELWGTGELPLFFYESFLNILLFAVLLVVYRREVRGSTFGGYLVGYGMIRIVLEPLREVSWDWGTWGAAQWFGLTAIAVGVMILFRKGHKIWR